MKKLKKVKSAYASGAPDNVRIQGGSKALSKEELLQERASMLNIIAALVEESGGKVIVSEESARKVAQEGRMLQLRNTDQGFEIRFDNYEEPNDTNRESFIDSDAAREAREYLARVNSTDLGRDSSGISQTEQESGISS